MKYDEQDMQLLDMLNRTNFQHLSHNDLLIIKSKLSKLIKAAKQTGIREITIGGGVSANSGLRNRIEEEGRNRGWNTYLPEFKFTTDNAAMIAIAGYFHYLHGERTPLDVAPVSRIADF